MEQEKEQSHLNLEFGGENYRDIEKQELATETGIVDRNIPANI